MPEGNTFSREELILGPRLCEVSASSADSDLVAFTQKVIKDGGKSSAVNLWLHNASSKQCTQMTRLEKGGVSNPVFAMDMPGAENAILYNKGGQVWALPLGGGESSQVTHFEQDIEAFKVFKGTGTKIWLLCVMGVYPGCTPKETAARDKENEGCGSAMVFDKLMVRHWDTWNCYAKRNHLFLCQLTVQDNGMLSASSGSLFDTMLTWESDCPSKPFGGSEEFCASPDGQRLAMACRRVEEDGRQPVDTSWSTCVSIYVLDIPEGLHEMNQESVCAAGSSLFNWNMISDEANLACATSPSWSPDGRKLSYLSMHRAQYESDHLQIMVWDASSGKRSNISSDIDLSFGGITWESISTNRRQNGIVAPASNGSLPRSGVHGSMAEAAASGSFSASNADEDEPPREYVLYTTAQYRATNRIFRLTCDNTSDMNVTRTDVMVGDETRSALMLVSAMNAFTKNSDQLIYFVEGSLSSPNVLKCAELSHKSVFTEFAFGSVSDGLRVDLQSGSDVAAGGIREVFCPNPQYFNGDLLMPAVQQYYFASKDAGGKKLQGNSDLVHCWYLPPTHLQSAEDEASAAEGSIPMILIIHGGPQGAIMNAWNYRWNLSYYAAQGYGVAAVNFHGSSGFGVKYLDSIRGDWGGQPYRDCMESVQFFLNEKKYLNRSKVGALGASYGGYMINWINGHDPSGIFQCLVNHDGIFGLRNLYFTTEEQWFPEWEFGLPYVTNPSDESKKDARYDTTDDTASKSGPSQYDLFDPSIFVDQWKTPTLVIQGCKDYRVVETEGIATFTALQRKRVESKFLVFPDENHWCLKPLNSMQWYGTVTDWLARYLK